MRRIALSFSPNGPDAGGASLFRAQAQIRTDRELGRKVAWRFARPRLLVVLFSGLITIGIAALLQLEYAEKLSVQGAVRNTAEPVRLHSPVAGYVSRVPVHYGQRISAGADLLAIDTAVRGRSGRTEHQRLAERLSLDRAAMARQLRQLKALGRAKIAQLRQRRVALRPLIESVSRSLDLQQQRLLLIRADTARMTELMREGWVSGADADQRRMVLLEAQAAEAQQHERLRAAEAELMEIDTQIRSLVEQQRLEEQRLADRMVQLRGQISEAEESAIVLITAPIDGRVIDLQVHAGKYVSAADHLVAISPLPDPGHEVDLWLTAQAVGRVRRGAEVRLRYAGYPFEEYGGASGRVLDVSDVPQMLENRPMFRARVEVRELPQGIDYLPQAMTVSADILLRKKTLGAWLVGPLAGMLDRI